MAEEQNGVGKKLGGGERGVWGDRNQDARYEAEIEDGVVLFLVVSCR